MHFWHHIRTWSGVWGQSELRDHMSQQRREICMFREHFLRKLHSPYVNSWIQGCFQGVYRATGNTVVQNNNAGPINGFQQPPKCRKGGERCDCVMQNAVFPTVGCRTEFILLQQCYLQSQLNALSRPIFKHYSYCMTNSSFTKGASWDKNE